MEFTDLVRARTSTRTFLPTPVPFDTVAEIVALAQWAPSSCNLQLTQVIAVDDPELLKKLTARADKKFSWAPCILVLAYDARMNRGRQATEVSLGGIMQTILLGATDRGLACCSMAGFKGDAVIKEMLGIPAYMELGLMIALGYPAKDGTETKDRARLPLETFLMHNRFSEQQAIPNVSVNVDDWNMHDLRSYRERIAPVYLYNEHNRLASFSPSVTEATVEMFEAVVPEHGKRVLDLCTYDGVALQQLVSRHPDWLYFIAEHIPFVGRIHERSIKGSTFISMDDKHVLDLSDASVDVVTCFHKLEFTPEWQRLLSESIRVLRPGGILFVTTMERSWVRRMMDAVRAWRRAGSVAVNVYDGNPYYKIGPRADRSITSIQQAAAQVGFRLTSSGHEQVAGGGKLSHTYAWGVFTKS